MPLKITALGSSFAAGISIPPATGPKAASRSASNYAHLLSSSLSAQLTDLTISGATLKSIAFEPQITRSGESFPPQVEGLEKDVEVVTITAGGNDLGYVGALMLDSVKSYTVGSLACNLYDYFSSADEEKEAMSEEELTELYLQVLDAIHARAPKAKVFIVEYLTLLGPDAKPGDVPLSAEQIVYHRSIGEKLQRATAKAADARKEWCECAHVHHLSREHGIGSNEPWVEGFGLGMLVRGIAPFHPNAAGHRAVAGMLEEKLRK